MVDSYTVLIVEDDFDDALILKTALKREGMENSVQVVSSGLEAMDYICAKGKFADRSKFPFPSVVFTDLKMPRMGGFEVLEWLRNHPDTAGIPVIILTSSRMDKEIRRAYQMGANAYLVKPSSIEDLQKMVKTAFEFWRWCEVPRVAEKC